MNFIRIQIVKCSSLNYWYKDKIGEVMEAVLSGEKYHSLDEEKFVHVDDAIILEHVRRVRNPYDKIEINNGVVLINGNRIDADVSFSGLNSITVMCNLKDALEEDFEDTATDYYQFEVNMKEVVKESVEEVEKERNEGPGLHNFKKEFELKEPTMPHVSNGFRQPEFRSFSNDDGYQLTVTNDWNGFDYSLLDEDEEEGVFALAGAVVDLRKSKLVGPSIMTGYYTLSTKGIDVNIFKAVYDRVKASYPQIPSFEKVKSTCKYIFISKDNITWSDQEPLITTSETIDQRFLALAYGIIPSKFCIDSSRLNAKLVTLLGLGNYLIEENKFVHFSPGKKLVTQSNKKQSGYIEFGSDELEALIIYAKTQTND